MFRTIKNLFSTVCKNRSGTRSIRGLKRSPVFRAGLEELEGRVVLSTTTFGVQDWGSQVYAPYVNVQQPQANGNPLDYVQAAQQGNVKNLVLGFIDADSAGNASWQGDPGSELGNSTLDEYISGQVDNLRNQLGGDVMISFGGEDDGAGQSTELAVSIASTMGTGTAALNQLVTDYQQVIDAYHLTHIDFDIEGDAETDTASINLRSQALAQLQQNNPGLQVYFTLGGDAPFDADLQFGMTSDAQTVVNSALDAGVNIASVNLMTMDFSNFVNYYDDTPANQLLYGQQLNPGNFGYAGDDPAEDGIQNVADVVTRNANAEFDQLQQMLTAHGINETDAQIWQMVGVTPEIGRNSTDESQQGQAGDSNVIFSLADAQTVETFAQTQGIGRISMWALGRDQNGNPNDPAHYETNSSLQQSPYAFSQIFSTFASGAPAAPPAPTGVTATAGNGQVTLNWTAVAGADSYNIYRGTASGQEAWVVNVSTPGFTDTGLTDGTTYFYTVTAGDGNLEGPQSSEVSATPSAQQQNVMPELVVAIPGSGVSGFEPGTGWTNLNVNRATVLASDSTTGNIAANFSGQGVWRYEAATGQWTQLSTSTASSLAIDSNGDVVGEFVGHGIWRYTDTAGTWSRLTHANASSLAINADGTVAATITGRGVWRFEDATGWTQLKRTDASMVAIDGNGAVIGEFVGHGVYRFTDTAGKWIQLTHATATALAVNENGDVAAALNNRGVWRFEDASGWTQLKPDAATQVAITTSGDVAAVFSDLSVSLFEDGTGWNSVGASGARKLVG